MRLRAPWLRHAGPPMQPFSHAMPSMKFSWSLPFDAFSSAVLQSAMPLQEIAFRSKSALPCSFSAYSTAVARPPQRANTRPKYDARSSLIGSMAFRSMPFASNRACITSNVIVQSTY